MNHEEQCLVELYRVVRDCTGRETTLQEIAVNLAEPFTLMGLFTDCAQRKFPGWPDSAALQAAASAVVLLCGWSEEECASPLGYVDAALRFAEARINGMYLMEFKRSRAKDDLNRTVCKLIREILPPPLPSAPPPPSSLPWPVSRRAMHAALIKLKKDLAKDGGSSRFFRVTYGQQHDQNSLGRPDYRTGCRDLHFYLWNWDASNDLVGRTLPAWKQTTDRLLDSGIMWWAPADGSLAVDVARLDAFLQELALLRELEHKQSEQRVSVEPVLERTSLDGLTDDEFLR